MLFLKKPKLIYYGHPILSGKAAPIDKIDHHIEKMARQMVAIMEEKNGVGLAAPQIGIPYRMFVIIIKGDDKKGEPIYGKPEVMINPSYVPLSEEMSIESEGCLSLPGFHSSVLRYQKIRIEWTDLTYRKHSEEVEGWRARVFQHEYDHLEGLFFVEKVLPIHEAEASEFVRLHEETFSKMNEEINRTSTLLNR